MKMKLPSRRVIVWTGTVTAISISSVMHISAATHYVSQTSPNPMPPYSTPQTAAHTIQDAVNAATDGDTVQVAPGDYGLTNQVTVTNAIHLQGANGASQTFVTGQDNTWCLRMSNSLAVADGLTFRPQGSYGSALGAFVVGGTIQNCNFTNFYVGNPGGAIVISGGIVSNSIVTYRRAGAGAAVSCSDGGLVTDSQILGLDSAAPVGSAISLVNSRLQNSTISGVPHYSISASGPAVSAVSSSVVGCTISNNVSLGNGGGAYLQDSFMDRCIVTGNLAGDEGRGGGGIFETNSTVRNSLIFGNNVILYNGDPNYGTLGGGVYMQGGALVNCTVSGNSAFETSSTPGGGGGVFADGGGLTNCIIYFNSITIDRASSNWLSTGAAVFDHCCTVPDPGGAGNLIQDPQFIGMTSGDYHLASSSPCIGAGVVQPWMTGAQDLDQNPRTTAGKVDMGAYQSQYQPPSILSIMRSGSNVVLRWPVSGTSNLVLEQSPTLTVAENWTPSSATVIDNGTNKSVSVPATNNVQFFRLRKP